jgi:hypothetical protein
MHYAYYVSGDKPYIASWVDHHSQVTSQQAPVPKFKRFSRELEE